MKTVLVIGICFVLAFVALLLGIKYVKANPEQVTSFVEKITLPYKIAKLAAQEPDSAIVMPVYGVKVSGITDTWGAPRGSDRKHEGQDIFATRGTPIFSGTAGYVLYTGKVELGGNVVYIIGAGGRRYYYAHLDSLAKDLHVGQKVTTDTVLGYVGNTGNASTTPPHLHFGVYHLRQALNPLPILKNR